MTKAELIKQVSDDTNEPINVATKLVEATIAAIENSLKKGETLTLRGFATISVKTRKAKTAQNITKGVSVQVPAKKVLKFKPAKELANEVAKLPA